MEYNFREIEIKWQKEWADNKTFKVNIDSSKPKYYVLDMFPYPSGAGLHVGHPLGYIASDIYARYKRNKGFNVLHPMGYDAYGLPAEQYAIQTGTHPEITTSKNIARYREQMDKIGFSFDWDREVKTCDPSYYKWTQWTFIQLFNHWFNPQTDKAEPIQTFIDSIPNKEWLSMSEIEQQKMLMNHRLAYLSDTMVNWCPELGTVLANDEVANGLSVRGGHPVERKVMRQWALRITAYAERLLNDLEGLDWTDSIKEVQRNWIGKSKGAALRFTIVKSKIGNDESQALDIFTTRPDTVFGVTFMVLCPEHDMIAKLTTDDKRDEVERYIAWAKNRSERERQSEVKKVSGVFTGSYAINPFTNEEIPIWVSEYVLAGYGTGAIMAVPAHDSRDYAFAKYFGIPIIQVIDGGSIENEAHEVKDGKCINSGFITGMTVKNAANAVIEKAITDGIGHGTTNYRLRDAIFSRQRYWGEPFPMYYKEGMPYAVDIDKLPITLPAVDKYLPTESGEPPLARANNWTFEGYPMETNTMPGFAGSSAYYLRYMDPHNDSNLVSQKAADYWRNVDLYIGGAEHATGHLIYSRFWNKFLYDIGVSVETEPFKKMINQGMIQGRSNFVYRINNTNTFVSYNLRNNYEITPIHVDVNIVTNDILDIDAFRKWRPDLIDAQFILEDDKYICGWEVEKMSKSLYNVQNPDDIIEKYGADTLRLYEMFLGPIEQAKPWDTQGIEGVYRFIRKFWRLYHDSENNFLISELDPTKEELKILHKTIKKIDEDILRFSFNTSVSAFMICVNELTDLKCNKRQILEPLAILISPFAPHIAEELWQMLGNNSSIVYAPFPQFDPQHLVESSYNYPVSFNGKTRFMLELPLGISVKEIETFALSAPESQKWIEGRPLKKIIIVPNKIINIVI